MTQSAPTGNPVSNPEPATILLVEDEVLIRLMVAEELRAAGFVVLEAGNADEAMALLAAVPRIALVFTDVRMPGSIDGRELAETARAARPDLKLIVASADEIALRAPVTWDASLRKPYDVAAMIRCVRRLLGEGSCEEP